MAVAARMLPLGLAFLLVACAQAVEWQPAPATTMHCLVLRDFDTDEVVSGNRQTIGSMPRRLQPIPGSL